MFGKVRCINYKNSVFLFTRLLGTKLNRPKSQFLEGYFVEDFGSTKNTVVDK